MKIIEIGVCCTLKILIHNSIMSVWNDFSGFEKTNILVNGLKLEKTI